MPSFFRIPKRANPDRRMEAPVARILDEGWAPVSGRAGPEECVAVSELHLMEILSKRCQTKTRQTPKNLSQQRKLDA